MNNMFFGDKLKKEREKRGWSQEALAEKIHEKERCHNCWVLTP